MITEAYETLSDNSRRSHYNNYLDSSSYPNEDYKRDRLYFPVATPDIHTDKPSSQPKDARNTQTSKKKINIHSEAVRYVTDFHLTKDFYGLFKMQRNNFDVDELTRAFRKLRN